MDGNCAATCYPGALAEGAANVLADLILRLRHPDGAGELVAGQQAGVFHLLVEQRGG